MHLPGDDDNEEVFAGTPEEFVEKMKEMVNHQRMVMTDIQHRVQRLFTDMDAESLATMRLVLHSIGEDPGKAMFYEGVAAAILLVKHEVCSGCGVDHTAEALASMTEQVKVDHPSVVMSEDEQTNHADAMVNLHSKFVEFEVLPVQRPKDGSYDGPVTCRNCGMEYVSLQDRMLEKPGVEGCTGCVQKAKFG